MRSELTRKAIHSIVATALAFAPLYLSKEYLLIVCAVMIVGATVVQNTAWLLRYFELDRSILGAIYIPIGAGLSAWYFLPGSLYAYIFGMLVLAFADTAAALIGKRFGINPIRIGNNKRTLEGSLAFFIVTVVLLYVLPIAIPVGTAVVIGVILTHVELFAPGQTDNIFIPGIGAALVHFLL